MCKLYLIFLGPKYLLSVYTDAENYVWIFNNILKLFFP